MSQARLRIILSTTIDPRTEISDICNQTSLVAMDLPIRGILDLIEAHMMEIAIGTRQRVFAIFTNSNLRRPWGAETVRSLITQWDFYLVQNHLEFSVFMRRFPPPIDIQSFMRLYESEPPRESPRSSEE